MRIAVLGVDLGKNVCSIVGLVVAGAVVARRRARRDTLIRLSAICRRASLRWTPVAAPIIWAGCPRPEDTTCA
jgi:hypothetical protein